MSNFDLVIQLFLQLTVILATCRIVTILGSRYLGQTDVVCEMIAGVMLGPSLLGLIAPHFQQWLFPKLPMITSLGDKIPNPSLLSNWVKFSALTLDITANFFVVALKRHYKLTTY
ncbi:hypothetical protein [Nostoc sp.]|uniref:hypothetical protein n=1 Tax=Nostoc sp. TaxID=1180 RepID=UPI002FFC8E9B